MNITFDELIAYVAKVKLLGNEAVTTGHITDIRGQQIGPFDMSVEYIDSSLAYTCEPIAISSGAFHGPFTMHVEMMDGKHKSFPLITHSNYLYVGDVLRLNDLRIEFMF